MFYSQIILAKKGPLGQLWMAAHFNDRKLSRPQIFATDISESVDNIVHPAVPLALRVSGHLLLGVVRIYSRKVHYLWQDCHQAMSQIQMAFLQPANADQAAIDMKEGGKETKRARRSRSDRHDKDGELEGQHQQLEKIIPATTMLQGFGIPFDLNDDTFQNAEDWVPAELDRDNVDVDDGENPVAAAAAALGLPDPDSPRQGRRARARAAADLTLQMDESTTEGRSIAAREEEWTAFDPDEDEEEEEAPKVKESETSGKNVANQASEDDDEEMRESNAPKKLSRRDDKKKEKETDKKDANDSFEEEDAAMLPPDDDEEQAFLPVPATEDDHPADQSSMMQAEVPRADQSVASDLATGRPSAVGELAEQPRMSEHEFSLLHDVSGIQILDDDDMNRSLPASRRASSFYLDQSLSGSVKPHEESSAAAVSLGGGSTPGRDEDEDEGKLAKKRKSSTAAKKKRKRRKIRANDGDIELTSGQIRTMLADASDIVNRPPPIGEEDEAEDISPELKNLIVFNVSPLLMNFLTYEQAFGRPGAFDDGGASPELLELWAECSRLRDSLQPQAVAQLPAVKTRPTTRLSEKEKEEDQSVQDVAQDKMNEDGEESIPSDGSAEGGRLPRESERHEPPVPLEDEEEDNMPLPPDEEELFPHPTEEGGPVLPDDEEPPQDDLDETAKEEQGSRKSSLSLGLVNTLGEDMAWDAEDEENEEDARQVVGDEIVSSNSKWHKHTIKVYSLLKSRMALPGESSEDKEAHLYYNNLSDGCSRRTAVGVFFELLQLKTWDFIELNQEESYGDITISAGAKFTESAPK